jgi:hypothetical protein
MTRPWACGDKESPAGGSGARCRGPSFVGNARGGSFCQPDRDSSVKPTRRARERTHGLANQSHSLRRTNEDKGRAVMTMLEDGEWCGWADNEIARRCGVSQPFVGKMRSFITVISGGE